jgi:hypothetical protein
LTLIIAYLQGELGFSGVETTAFWACTGAAAVAGAFVWGPMLARARGGLGMAAVIGTVMVGNFVPLVFDGRVGAYVSAVIAGSAFLTAVTAMMTVIRRSVPPARWTTAMAFATTAFSAGQCVGPILAGVASDGRYGIAGGLMLSGAILATSAAIALWQREPAASSQGATG